MWIVMAMDKCPKCGSQNLWTGRLDNVSDTWLRFMPDTNTIMNRPVKIKSWVCMECGYIETYVAEMDRLKQIAEEYRK